MAQSSGPFLTFFMSVSDAAIAGSIQFFTVVGIVGHQIGGAARSSSP